MADTKASGWIKFALVVAIVGAVNWGLIGLFNFNLVDAIFGGGAREETSALSRIIYTVVGLCGLVSIYFLTQGRRAGTGHIDRRVRV